MPKSKLYSIIQTFPFFKSNFFPIKYFSFLFSDFSLFDLFFPNNPILNYTRVFFPMNPILSLHESQWIRVQGSTGFTFKWNPLTKSNLAWVFRSSTYHLQSLRTDHLIKNSMLTEITVLPFVYMIFLGCNSKKISRKFLI